MLNLGLWCYLFAVLQFKKSVKFILKNEVIDFEANRPNSSYISRKAHIKVIPGGHKRSKTMMIEDKNYILVIEPYNKITNIYIPNHFVSKDIPMYPFFPKWLHQDIGVRLVSNQSSWVQFGDCVIQQWMTGEEINVTEVWTKILLQILQNNKVYWSEAAQPCESGMTRFLETNEGLDKLKTIELLEYWVNTNQGESTEERFVSDLTEEMRSGITRMLEMVR